MTRVGRWGSLLLALACGACTSRGAPASGGPSGGQSGQIGAGGAGTGGVAGATAGSGGAPAGSDAGDASPGDASAGETGVIDPGTDGDGDYTIGPTYTPAPELTVAAGVPRGQVNHFTLSSAVSKIYPSDVASGNAFNRDVWVYVPAQYVAGTAAPFMVVQDGSSFTSRIPPVLDTMINDKRLPVMIAVLINPGPGDGQGSERGLEYDTVSDAYVTFIETEILPKVQSDYGVTLTADPEGRSAVGSSSGGAAAFTMGWFRPDLYHRIVTWSGSFVALHEDAMYPHGAWEYHEHLIAESDLKPLRVFLQASQNDNNKNAQFGMPYFDWLQANMNMSAALAAKGYHRRYLYAQNATHADDKVIRQTLPDALSWAWRGYPVN
jgi:enterochelin esterase-like enzyme